MKLKDNKILFLLIGTLVGVVVTIILSPNKTAKLSDGSGIVLSAGDIKISANDYYSVLKREDRLNLLLREVNIRLIKEKYPNRDSESTDYANQQYDSFKQQIALYGMDEADALKQYGYLDKDDFIKYAKEDYYLQTYYEDALKDKVDLDEIRTYYDNNYFPTKHVYIFSSTNKSDLNKVKKQLDKGTKVSKVISNNSSVAYNDFDIDFYVTSYGEDVLSLVKDTKVGKTTSVSNNEIFGNYIIYVESEQDVKAFEDLKEEMINNKIYEFEDNDSKITYKVMIDLQKENNIDFKDEELRKAYEDYKKEYYQ